MAEKVDVDLPVKVTIEITGPDLDTCLYAVDEVREQISRDKTSGAVHVAHAESYKFEVVNLDG